jgi:HTH-type transcriptional repressor of NAD biosynthesis genes
MTARHGLIVGKFYPPHIGHDFLIDTAAAVCDEVTVIVAASSVETIPTELRVAWVRAAHRHQADVHVVGCVDDHPIDYDDPEVWDLHMTVFRHALARSETRQPVDAVFTVEPYGEELARRLGAQWAGPGLGRQPYAVSASAVRADPPAHWEDIAPPVRGWLAKRVVLVGAESTGTTTLTRLPGWSVRPHPVGARVRTRAQLAQARRPHRRAWAWWSASAHHGRPRMDR